MSDEDKPTFFCENKDIFLRCVTENGDDMGALRIARAELAAHADTLVNAANAGLELFKQRNVERGLRQLLDGEP